MLNGKSVDFLSKEAEDALVARATRQDGAAMTELLERYEGLIARSVRHIFRCSPELWQDARSVAVIAFIQAVRDYEAAPQSHFAALARSRVRTALVDMLRHERHEAEHAAVHPEQMELDGDCWELIGGTDAAEHGPEQIAVSHDIIARAMHMLTDRERELLQLIYLCDMTQDDVCARLQVSAASLSRTKKRLLKKLRRTLNGFTGSILF